MPKNRTRSIKPPETPLIKSGRWWLAHLLVISVCALFINFGFWQLRRLEERRLQNTVWQARLAAAPLPIDKLLTGAGSDLESLEFRPAQVRGTFAPDHEILVRSQVWNGTAGFHVVTPLVMRDGRAVLVNRGWVPLEMDEAPVPAMPGNGEVDIVGTIRLSQTGGSIGTTDPSTGKLIRVDRVDIERIAPQLPWPVIPVYVVAQESGDEGLPIPVAAPDLTDEGPHLAYAVQWFAFALIGLVGYGFLLRRAFGRRSKNRDGEPINHLD